VLCNYNPGTQETEAGEFPPSGQPRLHSKTCLKQTKQNNPNKLNNQSAPNNFLLKAFGQRLKNIENLNTQYLSNEKMN
jgi:hypothetical protein